MIAPARVAALHALRQVENGSADLPAALAHARTQLTDARDQALTAEIVSGSLRWQRASDHLIAAVAQRPLDRLDADVLRILRLSIYQLLHLSRVPASAVVDDAVDLVRRVKKPSAAGFVNAVLRSLLRRRRQLPLPERPDGDDREAALAYLGITHSHPDWLVERWFDRYGFESTEAWVRFNNETPALTLRANRLRVTREQVRATLEQDEVETEPTTHAPDGLIVREGRPLRRAAEGLFFVQDEASQLVPLAVDARPGERILDLCAAPGGKTTALAAAMHDEGVLVASDIRPRRLRLLGDTVRHSGAQHTHVVTVPARGPLPFGETFDRVLVDAPCSGLGTIRRDPDIRWRRQPSDLAALADTQVELLIRAAAVVKPGGRLVYATCSSEPDENDAVVDRFLSAHAAFTLLDLRTDTPSALTALLDERGQLRTLPFAHQLEAFFAVALVRRA